MSEIGIGMLARNDRVLVTVVNIGKYMTYDDLFISSKVVYWK